MSATNSETCWCGSLGHSPSTVSWNTKTFFCSVANLTAHPLSLRVYGTPTASEELLASVEKLGVLSAIIIDKDNRIIAGTSRHYASQVLHQKYPDKGFEQIPAVLFEGTDLEAERLVLETNRQRVKTPSQLGREFNEWFRIEQEFARLREVEGGRKKVPLKSADAGDARDKAARAINLGRTKAEQLGKLTALADQGNHKASNLLQQLDNGKISVSAAYAEIRTPKKATPADCPVCKETFPSLTQLKKHARREHQLEATEFRKRLGFPVSEPQKCNESITNARDLEITINRLIRRLEQLLPASSGSRENDFVRDIQHVCGYLSTHAPHSNWHAETVKSSVGYLHKTMVQTVHDLNVYLQQIPESSEPPEPDSPTSEPTDPEAHEYVGTKADTALDSPTDPESPQIADALNRMVEPTPAPAQPVGKAA